MQGYRHVLVAVDLADGSDRVARRAADIARYNGARLSLLHVVEYVPVEPMGEALLPAAQIESHLIERARQRLGELVAELGLADCEHRVEAGNIKAEIVRCATEQAVDLIVLGSRERHGLALLVNFTEDGVLHAAPCDVLAVRLPKS